MVLSTLQGGAFVECPAIRPGLASPRIHTHLATAVYRACGKLTCHRRSAASEPLCGCFPTSFPATGAAASPSAAAAPRSPTYGEFGARPSASTINYVLQPLPLPYVIHLWGRPQPHGVFLDGHVGSLARALHPSLVTDVFETWSSNRRELRLCTGSIGWVRK